MIIRRNVKVYNLTLNSRFKSSTTRIFTENLAAPAYKPEVVEANKYDEWESRGLFTAKNSSQEPVFSVVLPPPNVTGKLHLGHALSCTIQDVIVRRKRSLGHNVLWLPGTDHAGIATQGVVENYLKSKQNVTRHEIGREKFNTEVWKWKEKHGNTICNQLRTLGCSLDWSRQVFTMDQNHSHAVNTAFIQLFERGLIYRKKALVNWCNALKSTVSDIEVENKLISTPTDIKLPGYKNLVKFGLMYNFAYKIYDSDEEVIVSTTTPETMLGDTAIAVHPNDSRYKHLQGKRVVHPFRNDTIPVIFDEMVDTKLGTGAVKITPAHSKIDNEVAKRHRLPSIQVINEDGLMQTCQLFDQMKRYDCRQKLVEHLDGMGLLKSIHPHQMTLPMCSRTGDVLEHLPKEQWFLSCRKLNKAASSAVINGQLKINPDKYIKNWINWTEDERDWCISRQLWWGHQIPAYKCSVDKDVIWIAATDEILAKIQASKYLRTAPEDINIVRDTDVLDTWFSSGIYPFAALGWPETYNSIDYKHFYPLNLMVTGHDILGFWVHRMVMLGIELTGKLPFNNILLHGVICDNKGAKMSKSKGNVIDPIDVINGISLENLKIKAEEMYKDGVLNKEELYKAINYHKTNYSNTKGIPECGVDALRLTLLSQDIKSHFVNFDVHQCHANKLFCNKIWQSIKYMQLSFDKLRPIEGITRNDLTYFDKWILSRLAEMVDKVNKAIDEYDFHLATKAIKTLIYSEFCDVYLEATKPGFDNEDEAIGYAHAHTLSAVLNTSLRCLAPIMIYITEELIPKIPDFENNIIHNFNDKNKLYFDYPQTKDFEIWKNKDLENQVTRLLNVTSLVRELKGMYNISNKIKTSIYVKTNDDVLMLDLDNNENIVLHLTKCGYLKINVDDCKYSVSTLLDKDTEIKLAIDDENAFNIIEAAKEKLRNKIKKLEDNLNKLEAKFSTKHYITSVPEVTKALDKEKLLVKKEEIKQLQRLI
ncbi:PREDICTED: valine--tRNA ligase-like [Papilio polytes]|uniref:valine--tRNA ligase-like n=1 Tax=Papilio polytes TaxID=76194 RepID=UPI0006763D7E|nr:PREDICTED: valine--tRNA ligase-like [Papilio polytes]